MSVAIVVIDSLRKDAFDKYFDWVPGRHFNNAYSTANWTAPAHASLFTGRYASEVGVHSKSRFFDCEIALIPEILSENGFTTHGLSANHNASAEVGFDRGFDIFHNPAKLQNPGTDMLDWQSHFSNTDTSGFKLYVDSVIAAISSDAKTIPSLKWGLGKVFDIDTWIKSVPDDGASQILKYVSQTSFGEKEFLFANLMEVHTPYNPPAEFNTVGRAVSATMAEAFDSPEHPDDIKQGYHDATNYISKVYQDIFSELQESFDYVITMADHGEMLGEQGMWNHGYGIFPELTHIPLVISGPESDRVENVDKTVSILDVHATVADIADVSADSRGESLVDQFTSSDVLAEFEGLLEIAISRFKQSSSIQTDIAQYDQRLRGIATREGDYAYETRKGLVAPDEIDYEISDRLDHLSNDVIEASYETDGIELNSEQVTQLENLGYL